MRIAIISHSTVDLRQQLFYEEFNVLALSPKIWRHQRATNKKMGNYELVTFPVSNAGNANVYTFPEMAYERIKEFNPDIIYTQNEPWQWQTARSMRWAKRLGCKHVIFTWENLPMPVQASERKVITESDLIVCGNQGARKRMWQYAKKTTILPQVGVDCSLFKKMPEIGKVADLVFVGRKTPEKGYNMILDISNGYSVYIPPNLPYEEMPSVYNRALIHVAPSYALPRWMEQNSPFSNVEALACEVPCITTRSGAIPEYLEDCRGAVLIPEKDEEALKDAIDHLLSDKEGLKEMGRDGREWVLENYSNEVIAKKLIESLEEVVS